ncbi:MAG TPA: MBOAT family protein [Verrucomicrobiae bacterium]|nr:MBOAT family protein [Verrucomicrobiae bacterium]
MPEKVPESKFQTIANARKLEFAARSGAIWHARRHMVFSAWPFLLVFLPITLIGFVSIPAPFRTARKLWLCVASVVFYAYWKFEYVPLLFFSIALNYAVAELLTRCQSVRKAKSILTVGVTANLLLLGYFKYTNFILKAVFGLTHQPFHRLDIILPLAISFFTFTQISYLVDVYRDRNLHYGLLDYTLFVVFFPHLIAGPIVRHWEIIPQYEKRNLQPLRVDWAVGLALFLFGLYKKRLLADPISVYANAVYNAAQAGEMVNFSSAWLGTIAYALQIYFDFSGYSDMAIGLARMFGIRFPMNFDSPYRAASIIEFWQRWHITLTRFLREYLYYPLGGNRRGATRQSVNIMITMLLSGLWHGAGWNFVMWGGLHGCYLLAAHEWRRFREYRGWNWNHWSYRGACVLVTFVAVLFAWVLFRAPNLAVASNVFSAMIGMQGKGLAAPMDYAAALKLIVPLLALAFCLPNVQRLLAEYEPVLENVPTPVGRLAVRVRLNAFTGVFLGICFFAVVRIHFYAASSPFLYFNF